ncbi:MAG TPA: hypothetical protein VLF40_04630 [Candidatus Saccharimonadales bacterium]|nr:hypothetical protein [Candidatus Saccharimonadales bacterium]
MEPARYLQLVHIDPVQMNSDVVVVYQEGADEFDFYTHTTVEQGLQDQLWRKVDKEPLAVDLAKLTFKQFMEDVFDEGIEPYWYYWTCEDAEWKEVGLQEGIGLRAVDGSIHPASDILYQIAHGKSEFKVDWPGN